MRVLELSLRNYRVFEEVDLELPARVIGIFGPNGGGKTALVESLLLALYGQARTGKDQIRTHGVLTDCEVRLVFQHGGHQYEIRRVIRGKNHQTEAELLVGGASLAVGVREVDAEVRRLLRMDQRVFRSSVFAEQKQLDAFSDLTRARRKEMVLRLLGIRPVDDARAAARKAAREAQGDAARLAGALPDLSEQEAALGGARETLAKAREAAREAETGLEGARERLAEAEGAFEESDRAREKAEKLDGLRAAAEEEARRLSGRREDLAKRIERLRADVEDLPALEQEAGALVGARDLLESARTWADAREELATAEAGLKALPEMDGEALLARREEAEGALRAAEAGALRAEAAREQAEKDLTKAGRELAKAGDLDPTKPCPTCGQPLGKAYRDVVAHREAEVAELEESLAAAAKDAKGAQAALKGARAAFDEAEKRADAARETIHRRRGLAEQAEKLRERVATLTEPFEGRAPDLADLRTRAERAEEVAARLARLRAEATHLAQAEADLADAGRDLEACAARIDDLADQRRAVAFDPQAHVALRERLAEARGAVEQARRDEREAGDAVKDAEKEVARLEADVARVKETAAKVDELREEGRHAERVALLLDGFRDHLVSRIGPELSREAGALFRELTNHEYEDLKINEEDLSIEIADGGTYFPIERFSGSEADLANLALRVAISTHLSRVAGTDVGVMVLDEVLGALDAERKDLMVQAMGRLAGRFHQLFVITHAEQVKDRFPASIEVRKVGRRRSQAVLV